MAPGTRRTNVVAAAGLAVAALIVATPAQAGSLSPRAWFDGSFSYTSHINCVTGFSEFLTGIYTGYYGTADVTWPRVGDLYYGHLVLYGVGSPCPGEGYVEPEVTLPPNTSFAISAANPVYCFALSPQNVLYTITAAQGCPQAPYPSYAGLGTYSLYSSYNGSGPYSYNHWWTLAPGWFLEIQFPMVSLQPMSGFATNSYLRSYDLDILGPSTGVQEGVFVAPNDLIFKDGFNTGNTSKWSPTLSSLDNGDLSVRADSALNGTAYGLRAVVNDTTPLYVADDTPNNQGRYRARFFFNPGNFDTGEAAGRHRAFIFIGFDSVPTQRRVVWVELKRLSGIYYLRTNVRLDDGTVVFTPFATIAPATHTVEFDFQRATAPGANNGTLKFWIDDVLQGNLTGLDNDTVGVDLVRLGLMAPKPGSSGMVYLDEFESRTTTAIGPY